MADNKDKQDLPARAGELKIPEKKIPAVDQAAGFSPKAERTVELREVPRDDEIVASELRREIDMMGSDEREKLEAKKKQEKIEYLGEGEKIKHLLQIARENGVFFAVQEAKKMNEPYLLDVLHDTLAKEGFYKSISSVTDDDNDDNKK